MGNRTVLGIVTAVVCAAALIVASRQRVSAQGPGRQGGLAPAAALFGPDLPVPKSPTAVPLPALREVTGPGPMYESGPGQWPGYDMKHFAYEEKEYFVSGTAAGEPYEVRLVIRRPSTATRFSGIVVAEPMHPIGAAHAFEYNSVYIMDAGHIAAEISTMGLNVFTAFNGERYKALKVTNAQSNEVLAQVGALVRSGSGPLAGLTVRRMVLWGTSASSAILSRYLPASAIYKTPQMGRIYDGFMPTSNGTQISPVDVPIIQVPTQHEFGQVATWQQDGDEPGTQFRVYEFPGMSHLPARNNPRFTDADCVNPRSMFPLEAYMSVALNHLIQWVDKGVAPPRGERVYMDMFVGNDGSLMLLDDVGNPRGGIRNPHVDVPVATIIAVNPSKGPTPDLTRLRPGQLPAIGPSLLCTLSAWVKPLSADQLKKRYGTTENFVTQFEAKLNDAEKAGWSLPVYHQLIMSDAKALTF